MFLKIGTLLRDLASTVLALRAEENGLHEGQTKQRDTYDSLVRQQKELLEPAVRDSRAELRKLVELRSLLDRIRKLREELAEFQELQRLTERELTRKESARRDLTQIETREVEGFCQTVEQLLRDWQYPRIERVVFSERNQDLLISGKERGSHGKGLRAISYAGFTIGLMRHCMRNSLPHPGLVVLDSPLVTFRKPDVPKGEQGIQETANGSVGVEGRDLNAQPALF